MGERAPATFWERRVLNRERTIIAVCIAIVAIYLPDRNEGVALMGLDAATLVIVKLATPHGWKGPTKRAVGTVLAWWVVATAMPTELPLWLPTVVIVALVPVPFFLKAAGEIVYDEDSTGRTLMLWWALARVQQALRFLAALAAWLVTWQTSGDLAAAILVAPAAIATAVGWPSLGLLALALATPAVAGSSAWWAIGTITVIVALTHRRVRPPRQAVGLPFSAALAGHPLFRRRVRRIDRLLERSAWARAEHASESVLEPPGPATTTAALRLARARLEQANLQGARDALDIAWPDGSLAIGGAVRRLQGEILVRSAQPIAALTALGEARSMVPYDRDHQARVALAAASALIDAGQYDDAVHQATIAAKWFRHPRDLVAQFRAARLLALAHWRLDELDKAHSAINSTLGIGASTRWMRQYGLSGGRGRNDEELIFSDDSVLLVEFARLEVLELQLKLDPRFNSGQAKERTDEDPHRRDLYHDLETYSVLLDVGGAGLDRAEVDLVSAEVHAADGHISAALDNALSAVVELDEIRHSLRAQADRAAWSGTFNRALSMALEFAAAGEDSVRVAELIELARVQAFPLLGAGRGSDEVALQAPPTVRVRGQASIGRGGSRLAEHARPRPVDLEHAAACAVGPEAWWLSFFHDGSTLTWALVPPSGPTHHGRVHGDHYLDLRMALHDLDQNLPVRLDGEDDADVDLRLFKAPFLRDPEAEAELSARLARLLLPAVLRDEALARHRSGRPPLRLAIAPDPLLAHVPWTLLVVDQAPGASADSTRLSEVAVWALAPSATLLVLSGDRPPVDVPAPLRLAVLDPADVPSLPAARSLADHLDGVTVLGGRHWGAEPATPGAVLEALSNAGGASTVLFGCHASQGDPNRPSSSALVLAATHPAGQGEPLTAGALLASPIPRSAFPAQVSLQACDTSDLAGAAGGEWLSLAPAFLASGARVVATTQFPLVDVAAGDDDGEPGRLLAGLIEGRDLAELIRSEQIEGLTRWRRHDGRKPPPLEDTPLAWAAHAVCSTGRAGQVTPKAEPLRVSSGLVDNLLHAAMSGTKSPNRTVNSADVLAGYLENNTEMISGSIPMVLMRASLLAILPRLLRTSRSRGPKSGVRPSAELLAAARVAGARSSSTGWLHPEHLVLAVLDGPASPGRRLLSALRLRSGSSLRNAVRTNLREANLGNPSEGEEVRPEIQGFVDEVIKAAQAGIDSPRDGANP